MLLLPPPVSISICKHAYRVYLNNVLYKLYSIFMCFFKCPLGGSMGKQSHTHMHVFMNTLHYKYLEGICSSWYLVVDR